MLKISFFRKISWSLPGLLLTALCLLVSAGCLTPTAYGQSTGGIKGTVRALNGLGLAGAIVTARQNGVDGKSTKANVKGQFVLDGLEPGIYNFVFDAKGYTAGVRSGVEIKQGKIKDMGDRLILSIDQGTQVIVRGSVFYKEGTSASFVEVEVHEVRSDGSLRFIGKVETNYMGEFGFRQPEGAAKLRFIAKYKDGVGTKDLDVDSAMIYHVAVSLNVSRQP